MHAVMRNTNCRLDTLFQKVAISKLAPRALEVCREIIHIFPGYFEAAIVTSYSVFRGTNARVALPPAFEGFEIRRKRLHLTLENAVRAARGHLKPDA